MLQDLDDYEQIPEDQVRSRAAESRSFRQLLQVAREWREADCTPVFIVAQNDPMVIACVSIESFGKYHH